MEYTDFLQITAVFTIQRPKSCSEQTSGTEVRVTEKQAQMHFSLK